jgi:N-acetylneuraminic acid mutarotase
MKTTCDRPVHCRLFAIVSFPAVALMALATALIPATGGSALALGTWTTTGSMASPRAGASLTLLGNGKVLAAGGVDSPGHDVASAELYNPSSGTWSPTGSMAAARDSHTATLLNNGKVLVEGGGGAGFWSSELYDPGTGTWSSAGSPGGGRFYDTATLLPDGRVLIAGGYGTDSSSSGPLASARLYDPATNSWSAAASMSTPRDRAAATLLPNGKVLVAGGLDNELGPPLASAELYDPSTDIWSPTGSMAAGRFWASATLLGTGKVLVAGGGPSAELYDPASGTWSATGSMAAPRGAYPAILLKDGKFLAVGGDTSDYTSTELYDPATGSWTTAGSMIAARYYHTAALLSSGKVLVVGGWSPADHSVLASAELYTPPDSSAPTTDMSLSGTTGNASWYTSPVLVTLSPTDPDGPGDVAHAYYTVDGGTRQTYVGPFSLSDNGVHALTYWSVDRDGNTETVKSASVRIDQSAPTINCGAPDRAWHGEGDSVACTASDSPSGLADPADASFFLSSTATRTVCDVAGNCATARTHRRERQR